MKILLADDHFLVLDGLELLLSTLDFVEETSRASNFSELKEQLKKNKFDIILLDINFGKYDGRVILKEIKEAYPEIKVVALTSHSDTATIKSSIKAGFDGFLLKIDGRDEIKEALIAVMNNENYYSPKTQQVFFESQTSQIKVDLTERELNVLKLIISEKTTKEIAEELSLSEKTIETHRGNVMLKLNVRNTAGMVRKAIMLGLVEI